MQLWELRAALLSNLFEDGRSPLTDIQANRYINMAMQDTYSWMVGLRASLLACSETVNIPDPAGAKWVKAVLTGAYTKVNYLFRARRTNAPSSSDDAWLEVLHVTTMPLSIGADLSSKPKVFVWERELYVLQPATGVSIEFWFVPYLSMMIIDADVPGQSNGVGSALIWPTSWQTPIVSLATTMALGRENQDVTYWAGLLSSERGALEQSVGYDRPDHVRM